MFLLACAAAIAALLTYPKYRAVHGVEAAGPIPLTAKRLPLDSDHPLRTRLGPLIFLDAWSLHSDSPGFGGLSAMVVRDGRVLALNDTGQLLSFGLPPRLERPSITPLPLRKGEEHLKSTMWDSESMIVDPKTGRSWVGFELIQRYCRYAPGFTKVEHCTGPLAIRHWPSTEGTEALVRLPDGRFLAFAEGAPGEKEGLEALLFPSDPTFDPTPEPIHLNYRAPNGYRPTDALMLSPHKLLVLNRRATLMDGFTAVLALVDISDLRPGTVLKAQEIARFAPPILSDNFEALSLERRGDLTLLWIASDDNHEFFQRTLLLKFALPPELTR